MILERWKQNVPCVPYDLNPRQHWMKEGTHIGVLSSVPSLSCLPSFSRGRGHLEGDGTFRDTAKCPVSNPLQDWICAPRGHMGHTGHLSRRDREKRGRG